MAMRITIHAEFGNSCPGSKEATEYLKRVVGDVTGVQFERKVMRRANRRDVIVQFVALLEESVEDREEAESRVDRIHYRALGGCDYENMVITDDGLMDSKTA